MVEKYISKERKKIREKRKKERKKEKKKLVRNGGKIYIKRTK